VRLNLDHDKFLVTVTARHLARMRVSCELIEQLLCKGSPGFKPEHPHRDFRIVNARCVTSIVGTPGKNMEFRNTVEILVEGDVFPVVPEGGAIPLLRDLQFTTTDG